MADPLFSAEVLAEGSRLGASLELDLRVRADGGFVVLHDDLLEGEMTGSGPVAEAIAAQLRRLRLKEGRPLTLSEDLASVMRSVHPEALLQFDMKDDFIAIGDRGMDHRETHYSSITGVIVGGASLELIAAIRNQLPNLMRGIDPTDKLAAIWRDRGLAGPTEPTWSTCNGN